MDSIQTCSLLAQIINQSGRVDLFKVFSELIWAAAVWGLKFKPFCITTSRKAFSFLLQALAVGENPS